MRSRNVHHCEVGAANSGSPIGAVGTDATHEEMEQGMLHFAWRRSASHDSEYGPGRLHGHRRRGRADALFVELLRPREGVARLRTAPLPTDGESHENFALLRRDRTMGSARSCLVAKHALSDGIWKGRYKKLYQICQLRSRQNCAE